MRRMLVIPSILGFNRLGLSLAEIHREVCEILEMTYSKRTIERDIAVYRSMGLIEETGPKITDNPCLLRYRLKKTDRAAILAVIGSNIEASKE